MATKFEMRGHMLYMQYLEQAAFTKIVFIFSIATISRIKYFHFQQKLSDKDQIELDYSQMKHEGRKSPGLAILAKAKGGAPGSLELIEHSASLTTIIPEGKSSDALLSASSKDNHAFVKVELLDIFRPMKFHMLKASGASVEEVRGFVSHLSSADARKGDPWKLPKDIDYLASYDVEPS